MSSYSLYSYNKQQFNNDVSFNNNTTLATTTITGVSTHSGRAVFTTDVSLNGATTISGAATFTAANTIMNGNVGIGITNPGQKLDITGNCHISSQCIIGATDNTLNYALKVTGGSSLIDGGLLINNGLIVKSSQLNLKKNIGSNNITDSQHDLQLQIGRLTDDKTMVIGVMDNGVGVIQVKENGNSAGYTHLLLNPIAGNVGIGITSPETELQINSSKTTTPTVLSIFNNASGLNNGNIGGVDRSCAEIRLGSNNGAYYTSIRHTHPTFPSFGGYTDTPRLDFCSPTTTDNNAQKINMSITSGGNVGIGTTIPGFPLHVVGSIGVHGNDLIAANTNVSNKRAYLSNDDPGFYVTSGNFANVSIRTSGYMWGEGFIGSSDTRIKTNIVDIDDEKALQILRLIKPKTYDYVDKIQRGNANVIGFIAQEIKEIIPKAVSIEKEYAPTFYTNCQVAPTDVSNILLVTSPIDLSWNPLHDLSGNAFVDADGNACSDASGNKVFKVKLYDQSNNEINCKTTSILDNRSFLMDVTGTKMVDANVNVVLESDGGYFLYGQEVDDFHSLDKNAIFTVVTAAVQDIDRKQLLDEAKIAELQVKNDALEAKNAALEARLAALEQAVAALQGALPL